jgi:2-oxoglutarate ferredoxin oxidoreductase subunit beta
MPALVAGIHVFLTEQQDVDGRDKPGHDEVAVVPAQAGTHNH